MKPAPFEYYAPVTLEEAVGLAAEYGDDGKLLAGGQSLIPVMNFRLAQPTVLIDLNGIEALQRWRVDDDNGRLHLGGMVRQAMVEKEAAIGRVVPMVQGAMPYVAHSQIRNRGTVGGSLAHADPAGELPVLAVARQARFKLEKVGGARWVEAEAFYQGLFETALDADEILTEVVFEPLAQTGVGTSFHEFARRHGDYALAGVAVVLYGENGVCRAARLVYLNVGDVPMVARGAAEMLIGNALSDELIEAAARFAADNEIDPTGDVHGSAAYRRRLAFVLGKRAIKEAWGKIANG